MNADHSALVNRRSGRPRETESRRATAPSSRDVTSTHSFSLMSLRLLLRHTAPLMSLVSEHVGVVGVVGYAGDAGDVSDAGEDLVVLAAEPDQRAFLDLLAAGVVDPDFGGVALGGACGHESPKFLDRCERRSAGQGRDPASPLVETLGWRFRLKSRTHVCAASTMTRGRNAAQTLAGFLIQSVP